MSALPITITAKVSAEAISKATKFYNATLTDKLVELFQNSRRANATHITLTFYDNKFIVEDDGNGIEDPSVILSFGESQWENNISNDENSAGMGFFALSNEKVSVSSKHEKNDCGWHVDLTPNSFNGKDSVQVSTSNIKSGTRIEVQGETLGWCVSIAERQAEYLGIHVTIIDKTSNPRQDETTEVSPKCFLNTALWIVETEFGRIGIEKFSQRQGRSNINFHGCMINQALGEIGEYRAFLDIKNINKLKLVLPARKEVIQDENFEELKQLSRKTIFQYIATLDHHDLGYKAVVEARSMGVKINDARPFLRTWLAEIADTDSNYNIGDFKDIRNSFKPILMNTSLCAATQQLLKTALSENDTFGYTIFETAHENIGYEWYDKIPTLNAITIRLFQNGLTATFTDIKSESPTLCETESGDELIDNDWAEKFNKPSKIVMELEISGQEMFFAEIDTLIIGDDEDSSIYHIFLTEKGLEENTPDSLFEKMNDSFFNPNNDESWETQIEKFNRMALHKARALYFSATDVIVLDIQDIVQQHISWRVPTDSQLSIEIKGGSINITHTPKTDIKTEPKITSQ